MGHRALIIIDNEDGTYTGRHSQWGAHGAAHLGDLYESMKNEGSREVGTYDSLVKAAQKVDFLFHEAVYLAQPGQKTRAFDTLWWRGAREYVPSPGGTKGTGALVELHDRSEWESFSTHLWNESRSMTADEFHRVLRNRPFAHRIPYWSPLGGDGNRLAKYYAEPGEV